MTELVISNPLLEEWEKVMVPYREYEESRFNHWQEHRQYPPESDEEMLGRITQPFHARRELVMKYAWAVPTSEAIQLIATFSPDGVIEIGAGTGYWARLLREADVDVLAYDVEPYESVQAKGEWSKVRIGGPEKAAEDPKRTLFLCWPPYNTPMAYDSLCAYRGSTLAYVGEGESGCTGDAKFHRMLRRRWEIADVVCLPQWEGIHDELYIYTRQEGR